MIDFWHLYSVRGTYITCLRLCDACVPDAAIAPIACICLYFCRFTVTVIAHCRQLSRTTVAEKQKKTPVKISQMPRDENTSAHFCGLFFNEKHVTNFGTWRNPETEIVPRNNRIRGAGAAGRSIYIRRSHPLSPAHVFLSECFIACQLLLLQQYMGHVVFGRAIALCYVISPAAFSAARTIKTHRRNKQETNADLRPSHNAPALPVTAQTGPVFYFFFLFATPSRLLHFSRRHSGRAFFSSPLSPPPPEMSRRRPPNIVNRSTTPFAVRRAVPRRGVGKKVYAPNANFKGAPHRVHRNDLITPNVIQ